MKYFHPFEHTGYTFVERIGAPEEVPAAIGLIALNFAKLEDGISVAIARVLEIQPNVGQIVVAEMSFKYKVHLLGSLLHRSAGDARLNIGDAEPLEFIRELTSQCSRAEELRNQVMDSSWTRTYPDRGRVRRRKVTAKASRGLHIHEEELDSGYLLDIADFIISVLIDLKELFLTWE
jgi:hypothetical protein